ncbi:MAG: DUF3883 domain-containing protein, partial [Anaerolineae bacterium]|nr:DUF3883 domain-containing protein [Anaerolineae bacterium]
GTATAVLDTYERVCFDKDLIHQAGSPEADFICPGHPLLDAVIDLVLEQYKHTLQTGSILVDETDAGQTPRVLFFLEQDIQDAGSTGNGNKRVISREVHFVEVPMEGEMQTGGYAPYIDYRPATGAEREQLQDILHADWLKGDALEDRVMDFAIGSLIPSHLERIRKERTTRIDKTIEAVHARLTKEINYWDQRAAELRAREKAGMKNARLNAEMAQRRADNLSARKERRLHELELEKQISATPPIVIGGALVVPIGLLLGDQTPPEMRARQITERIAMQAVMQAEIQLGHHPRDVSQKKVGYDIESRDGQTGQLRFIEVKGRRAGAETVTVTANEILTGLNEPEQFILALVEVRDEGQAYAPRYVRKPFTREPDRIVSSVAAKLQELLARSYAPR